MNQLDESANEAQMARKRDCAHPKRKQASNKLGKEIRRRSKSIILYHFLLESQADTDSFVGCLCCVVLASFLASTLAARMD